MTIEELREGLRGVMDRDGDEEDFHIHADDLLLEYIDDQEVTKLFKKLPKWHS